MNLCVGRNRNRKDVINMAQQRLVCARIRSMTLPNGSADTYTFVNQRLAPSRDGLG